MEALSLFAAFQICAYQRYENLPAPTANYELWKPATGAELYFRFRAILVRNYAGEVIDKEIT